MYDAEVLSCNGVVGRLLVRLERNSAAEGARDRSTMALDMSDLPSRQPQLQEGGDDDESDEEHGYDVGVHARHDTERFEPVRFDLTRLEPFT